MADHRPRNQVRVLRESRGWTQAQLADQADASRAAISAIEHGRLTPAVDTAMRIARSLGCRVEDVFSVDPVHDQPGGAWAWPPASTPSRYWQARVGERLIHIPSAITAQGLLPHDGICEDASRAPKAIDPQADRTLVMACCDPAVSLLLSIYAERSGYRPICLHRTSREAMQLLHDGVIHVAGVHLASDDNPAGNAVAARQLLGAGHAVLHVAQWESGVAVARSGKWTRRSLRRSRLRWIGRPAGSGARDCQDEVLGNHPAPRRTAGSHRGVVDALRGGWADAGVCLRLVCEEVGLTFVPIRRECFDLCLYQRDVSDPRMAALIKAIRSRQYLQLIRSLPGYQPSAEIGELEPISNDVKGIS